MMRLILVKPSVEYIDEIRTYRQEFFDDGGHFNGDSGLRKFEDIGAWIEQCHLMEHKETIPIPDRVEGEQFMLMHAGERRILGMISFRHYLNNYLSEYGGHIGYGIRPSERRKGYAKAMLALCLEKCRKFGLGKVLITCDEDNEGSRRTILSCGGVFERVVSDGDEKLERYWINLDKSFKQSLNCRKAVAADMTQITKIDRLCRLEKISAAINQGECYVVQESAHIIGFAIMNYHFFGFGFVDLLIVAEEQRRNGIGVAMLDYLFGQCKTEKLFTSTNESNAPMQGLLAKTGFVSCGQIDALDEGDPELFFVRKKAKP